MIVNEQPKSTHDVDIRGPLIAWLRNQHPDDGSTGFVEEFKMPRPSARIDLAVVNGEIAGFEIKSDADTLTRLVVQVPAFSQFFDKVSIVTTRKHIDAARKKIPEWWGIVICEYNGFHIARTAKQNRNIDVSSLLYALSKAEIAELGRLADRPISLGWSKDRMVHAAEVSIDCGQLRHCARHLLRRRASQWSSPIPITSNA